MCFYILIFHHHQKCEWRKENIILFLHHHQKRERKKRMMKKSFHRKKKWKRAKEWDFFARFTTWKEPKRRRKCWRNAEKEHFNGFFVEIGWKSLNFLIFFLFHQKRMNDQRIHSHTHIYTIWEKKREIRTNTETHSFTDTTVPFKFLMSKVIQENEEIVYLVTVCSAFFFLLRVWLKFY